MAPKRTKSPQKVDKARAKRVGKSVEVANTRWFKLKLIEKGVSQNELAAMLGVDKSAMNHMIAGRRKITYENAVVIARALGVPVEEFMASVKNTGEGPGDDRGLEISGWIDGALMVHKGAPRGPRKAPDPQKGSSAREQIEVLRCQTMGSQFDGIDGALVYYYPSKRVDPDSLQRMCIVEFDNGMRAMRTVKRGYSAGRFNLSLINGVISEEDAKIVTSSPVMWMKM